VRNKRNNNKIIYTGKTTVKEFSYKLNRNKRLLISREWGTYSFDCGRVKPI